MHKLLTYSRFLKENPEWRNRVILLQFLGDADKNASIYDKQRLLN